MLPSCANTSCVFRYEPPHHCTYHVAKLFLMIRACAHKCLTESPTATFISFKQHQAFELAESEPTLNPHLPEDAKKVTETNLEDVSCKVDHLRVIVDLSP
jgi:hypothetical protein